MLYQGSKRFMDLSQNFENLGSAIVKFPKLKNNLG